MAEKINIEGREITIKLVNEQDYISLTDIAKQKESQEPNEVIRTYINNRDTLEFLEVWEEMSNPDFKPDNFIRFKIDQYNTKKLISIKEFIKRLDLIGLTSASGRYGGTFAHVDIAFEFASWLSPAFKIRVIKEYQRLRTEEYQRQKLHWNASRELARLNYPLQTSAIKETTGSLKDRQKAGVYASEADMINYIVFGLTAKEWKARNPKAKGNLRDHASQPQNVVLANLESFNAELIRKGASQEARQRALEDMAIFQLKILEQKFLLE
ncbi:MAG: KilA-N domain-containing protein [Bacteroidota bacterium]